MIRQLFIINKVKAPVFSRTFTNQEMDMNLMSGFFGALDAFAEQIQGGQMDSLSFKDFQFIFCIDKYTGLRFILSTDKGDNPGETRKRLDMVRAEFTHIFLDQIEEMQKEELHLNEARARMFSEFLDDFQIMFQ